MNVDPDDWGGYWPDPPSGSPSPLDDFAPLPASPEFGFAAEAPKSMTIYLFFKRSATEEEVGGLVESYRITGLVYLGDPIDRISLTVLPDDPSKHLKVSVPLTILHQFEIKP